MPTFTKLKDLVDDEAAGWLCVTCWERMLAYEDGSEINTSSDYELVTDKEESNEEESYEESSGEDSAFLFSI
jgi:hypothetical protein